MTKRILIVDPFSTGKLYSKLFSKEGFECVAVKSSDELSKFYIDSFDNEYFMNKSLYSISFVKENFKIGDFFAVIAGSETGVIESESLAKYFKVKGNNPDSSKLRRNKLAMQKELKKNNIRNIDTIVIKKADDLSLNDLTEQSYIIKPLDSAGSEDVVFCENKDSLFENIKNLQWGKKNITGSINNSYLVQPFIKGDEYVIDMVVEDEKIVVSALCVYEKVKVNNSSFVYKNMRALDINDTIYNELVNYAKSAAKALQYKFGLVHMELIAENHEGVITNPVMIEAGGRLHGGVAPLLFELCYKPDLLAQAVNLILNGDILDNSIKVNEGRVVFMINTIENSSIDTDVFVNSIKHFPSFNRVAFIGDCHLMPLTTDLITCPCLIVLAHETETQIKEDEDQISLIFHKLCHTL